MRALDAVETGVSAVLGMAVSVAVTWWALPWWGLHPSLSDSAGITMLFFTLSWSRAYVLRRVFRMLSRSIGGHHA